MTICTAYDTLGEPGLRTSLVQTGSKLIFLDPHLIPVLSKTLKEAKEVKTVVYNTEQKANQAQIDQLKKDFPYLTVMSFDELQKLGEENPAKAVPPQPEDLACVMYTSGSTGIPKGVPLKHKAVIAAGKVSLDTTEHHLLTMR